MNRGNIIEFKRKGFISWFLGGLLKLFERDWDMYGWHLAIAWEKAYDGWYILEALAFGTEINYYSNKFLERNTRCWKWLDEPPTTKEMGEFLESHINKKYDVVIYFWTTLQYLIRHYFNHRIPKLLDDRWTCWELVADFCESMGKPIQSRFDCPLITDILRNFQFVGDTNA